MSEVEYNNGETGKYIHNYLSFWKQFGIIQFLILIYIIIIMTSPLQKLDNLIPSVLNKNSSRQEIINQTYKNNLGNNMLGFIQQLAFNLMRRNNGGAMCVPRVTWTPTKKVSLNNPKE